MYWIGFIWTDYCCIVGYLHHNGSSENDVFCHNSDCFQFTVFPFMFESVSEDLKLCFMVHKVCWRQFFSWTSLFSLLSWCSHWTCCELCLTLPFPIGWWGDPTLVNFLFSHLLHFIKSECFCTRESMGADLSWNGDTETADWELSY